MLHTYYNDDPMYRRKSESEIMHDDAKIEKLEREVAELMYERDIAQAELDLIAEKREAIFRRMIALCLPEAPCP